MKTRLTTTLGTGTMACVFLLQSCLKPEKYPIEPAITYKSFVMLDDPSAIISFDFTDGDGDIGLGEGENTPPYNPGSVYENNVFITYYEKVNGVWQVGVDQNGDPAAFNYRTKLLTPTGKNKALRGTISITMSPYYSPFSPDSDTIRYKIRMCDRALHMSNEVFTPEIVRL
jgi:hypothetical protein